MIEVERLMIRPPSAIRFVGVVVAAFGLVLVALSVHRWLRGTARLVQR